MPFIPYAVTLSLSVAYRKWHFSQLPMFRTRGGADFKRLLPVLQDMGKIWSSARLNGQLGQAVLLKLDQNECLNSKRKKGASDASKVAGNQSGQAGVLKMGAQDNVQQVQGTTLRERATTPPDAPSTPRTLVDPTEGKEPEPDESNTSLAPPASLDRSAPLPAASSLSERPLAPSLPLTWTTPWSTAPPPPSDNMASSSLAWALHQKEPTPEARNQPNTEQPYPPGQGGSGESNAAIPLPGNLTYSTNGMDGTSPVEGLDAFLADDDALFRSWDPMFAQSVDFSFSSILDPGNPFAWPEYCNYES